MMLQEKIALILDTYTARVVRANQQYWEARRYTAFLTKDILQKHLKAALDNFQRIAINGIMELIRKDK